MSTSLPYSSWNDEDESDPGWRDEWRHDQPGDERFGEHGPQGVDRSPDDFNPSGSADDAYRFPGGSADHAPVSRSVTCPKCGSKLTRTLQWGRRFGSIVGAVAGSAGGAAAGCIGAPRLPSRQLQWVSLISSAVIGGISGGTAGCRSGASLGDLLDERVLPNHRCLNCFKRFCHPSR